MSIAAEKPPAQTKTKPQTPVVVLDDLATEGLVKLDAVPGIEYDIRTGLRGNDLRDAQYSMMVPFVAAASRLRPKCWKATKRSKPS